MPVQEQVLDAIRRMSVADLVDLVRALEGELETSDDAVMTTTAPVEAPVEVSRGHDAGVSPQDLGVNAIEIIKTVREITDLGLREAQASLGDSPSALATGDHDSAEGPELAGVPVRPKRPSPSNGAAERLSVPKRPHQGA